MLDNDPVKKKEGSTDLISAAEFAKLVGTNKSTLRYYESIGLLEPFTNANNYRYYTPYQVMDYYRITSMQRIGYSLFDIRMPQQPGLSYVDWIKKKNAEHYETLKAQLFEMQRTMREAAHMQRFWHEASYMQPGVPMMVTQEKETYLYSGIVQSLEEKGYSLAQALTEHMNLCRKDLLVYTTPYGFRFCVHQKTKLKYLSYFSFSDPRPSSENTIVLPAGNYLKFLALGSSINSIQAYYPDIECFLREHYLERTTDLYASLLFSSAHYNGAECGISICWMGVQKTARPVCQQMLL